MEREGGGQHSLLEVEGGDHLCLLVVVGDGQLCLLVVEVDGHSCLLVVEREGQLCLLVVVEVDGQLCQQLGDDGQPFQLEEGQLQKLKEVDQLCQLKMKNSVLLMVSLLLLLSTSLLNSCITGWASQIKEWVW